MPKPPSLPLITQDNLPGEGWGKGVSRLRGEAIVCNTWKVHRRRIALLNSGTPITILSALSEVSKPDVIAITSPVPNLPLASGDQLLRYTERGEGNADCWTKGQWYVNADLGFITNSDGSGCQSACLAHELEHGRKTWWFRIRLPNGRIGWTDAANSLNQN